MFFNQRNSYDGLSAVVMDYAQKFGAELKKNIREYCVESLFKMKLIIL